MKISPVFFIDSCGNACQVAVFNDDFFYEQNVSCQHGHSEHIVELYQNLKKESDFSLKDMSSIIVTVGPGGFTGIRAGLAFGYGLSLALDIPIFGVDRFALLGEKTIVHGKDCYVKGTSAEDTVTAHHNDKGLPNTDALLAKKCQALFKNQDFKMFQKNPQPLYVKSPNVS